MIDDENPRATKRQSLTPKAIIHQKYGGKACYKVEEVLDSSGNMCPGLAIPDKGPCLYRCTLNLPDVTVVSDTCKKKKDAEQSAAQKAIDKLGVHFKEYNPTSKEAWEDMAGRLTFLFSNEFLSSPHPLSGHFRAALSRDSHFNGFIPVSVIAIYDTKIGNICKCINPAAASNSALLMSFVRRAAKLTDSIVVPDGQLSLKRRDPYPSEVLSSVRNESHLSGSISTEVICIPSSLEKIAVSSCLSITENTYYLDVIARELGAVEASDVLISRPIGKASSDMRIYSSAPNRNLMEQLSQMEEDITSSGPLNLRASYLASQHIYGDAILASFGYSWNSSCFVHQPTSLKSYYRIIVNKMPGGAYKLSRNAVLVAKLPSSFTAKSNWRGSLPRDVLCSFCRSNHFSEPAVSVQSTREQTLSVSTEDLQQSAEAFTCEVKIYSRSQELILQYSPREERHRKQMDAIQRTCLKVLHWLNSLFEKPDMSSEELNLLSEQFSFCSTDQFLKRFTSYRSLQKVGGDAAAADVMEYEPTLFNIKGQSSGVTPSSGCLASIRYSVSLISEERIEKEFLESREEFEFEFGNEAVTSQVEAAIAQISVGQTACFRLELLPVDLILAAADDPAAALSLLSSSSSCKMEYTATLLQLTEPPEDRMEKALFSPPLSKQRVEFALQHIKESHASLLVDFGCGSGSLLDSLLSYPTSLESIVGVDISRRSLSRAAKLLHTKLNKILGSDSPSCKIKSAVLYDGSIANFDSRLYGCDLATCLEVIEHMEEKEAWFFGEVALGYFRPKILIVSTPNYEYNVILQKSAPNSTGEDQEDDPPDEEENNPSSMTCKFRNHDHKFEWTRPQFEHWASRLAAEHEYGVEFSGVGGAVDVEPGFASQIAIFKRQQQEEEEKPEELVVVEGTHHPYIPIWEWTREEEDLA